MYGGFVKQGCKKELEIMCGRFTLRTPAAAIAKYFNVSAVEEWQVALRFNIAPTQDVLIVREAPNGEAREATFVRWGLIPFWATDHKIGNRLINARAETALEKRSFKSALLKRRCLVVADGWYEWQKLGSRKQPYLFQVADQRPFAFAGAWERWDKGGEPLETCTILTTAANELASPIHDRMPVIIDPANYSQWLDRTMQEPERIRPLLTPYDGRDLECIPVSDWVNNPRHEGPDCVEPV